MTKPSAAKVVPAPGAPSRKLQRRRGGPKNRIRAGSPRRSSVCESTARKAEEAAASRRCGATIRIAMTTTRTIPKPPMRGAGRVCSDRSLGTSVASRQAQPVLSNSATINAQSTHTSKPMPSAAVVARSVERLFLLPLRCFAGRPVSMGCPMSPLRFVDRAIFLE